MANEREITTVFKADISQFSASTQQLNRYIATVNSEFRNATASMGKWSDNTDGLQAKLIQLNGVLDAETRKLNMLEDQYAELVKQGKANTKEAKELAIAINDQSAKVKGTQKNIEHYTNSLKELEDAGVNTKQELEELKKAELDAAKAAKDAAKALEKELAEAARNAAEEQEKLNKELEEQKQAAKELGGGILKGAAVGVAGFAAACAGALGTISGIVEETKELRTQMGQLETAFTEQGHSVNTAKKTYDELYSVMGDSGAATEASLHLGKFAKSEKELEELTNSLTGAYARFGSSLPIENIAEGAATTLTLGQANAGMVDAIEFAGGSVEEFNEKLQSLDTEEEKRAFILQTLNESYGEAGEKYKEVNKEVIAANDAQNKYNQAMAEIGEKAQPAITSFKLSMVEVLQTVMAKFQEVDIEGLIGKISTAITTVVNVALPPLMNALTWVLDNLNWLAPVLGTVVGLIGGISAALKIYNTVVTIARTVQLAWNLALTANPIGVIIMAIAGLVAAFVTLWKKCDGFRNFFINLWEQIKAVAGPAIEAIGEKFKSIMNTVKGVINGIVGAINIAIRAINKIKVNIPDWVPEYGGKTIGFNLKEIPKLARGGIVDKPTLAMVGEAGREAVMPLENNTQWIDKLADKLSSKMGNSNVNYTINNTFEKMETTQYALHKANLETKRLLGGLK